MKHQDPKYKTLEERRVAIHRIADLPGAPPIVRQIAEAQRDPTAKDHEFAQTLQSRVDRILARKAAGRS